MGVTVLSFASDGDSKYVSAMKQNLKFGEMTKVFGYACPLDFYSDDYQVYFQDPPHKIKNLKNKFCDKASDLKIGFYFVTINHVINLIQNPEVSKNQHLLNQYDILNEDRMDYTMVEKISTDKVLDLMIREVDNSLGTVEFLKILRLLLEAFVFEETPVLKRVFNAFYALFFFALLEVLDSAF